MPWRVSVLSWLLAVVTIGCLHESPPTQLRGEIERYGARFIVTECSTAKTYELKLPPAAFVNLERKVDNVRAEAPGPVIVELGGKSFAASSGTAAEAIFEVHTVDATRSAACPR